ncbi:MAG: PAS domain S-box protein [candidate division Zixibacteria bacterium]|nr:PAS domain S-box protein [candidate division Zixibacteria bacterium]
MLTAFKTGTTGFNQRFTFIIVIALALTVLIITAVSIKESRSDSFTLLVLQGTAFTEALAQASENAIMAETFYDYLVQKRYSDLVGTLVEADLSRVTDADLARFALNHDLYSISVFNMDSSLAREGFARGPRENLPEFVLDEVKLLIADPRSNFILLLDEEESPGGGVHYYLELTNSLDHVVVLKNDATYYSEALRQTGIGYLAQNMAREKGVKYIIYQTKEGIIFASHKPGNLLAIESDPFLTEALDSDSIEHRLFEFQGETVLELIRPFATAQYPFGLFRVGLSLEKYYAVSRRYDLQMIILSGVLFVLLVVALLYLSSKRQRREINLKYTEMKTITDRIFEQMSTGVAVVDAGGTVRLVNEAFEKIFGLSRAVNRSWEELIDSEKLKLTKFTVGSTDADEVELSTDIGGITRDILVARSKIVSDTDALTSVVMVAYDITRLKEYERQSARRERLSEMGNLAAGVAHEIRNPLNTIAIAAQRLASEFAPEKNSAEYLSFTEKIRTETKRLNDIITRFLALAREERKKRTVVALGRLIDDFVNFIRVEADKLKIELETRLDDDLKLEGDADQLRQVFLNLFNNTKEALNSRPGRILITAVGNNDEIVVRFADDGPGVKPELREKVLSPYFTTKDSGTGLGLPTVYKIINDLGGDLKIEPSEWGGVEVFIKLPAAETE